MFINRGMRVARRAGGMLGPVVTCMLLLACDSSQPDSRVTVGPPALLEARLRSQVKMGDVYSTFDILEAADHQDPDSAYMRSLLMRQIMRKSDPLLLQAGRQALELLPRLQKVRPRAPYVRAQAPAQSSPEIAYINPESSNTAFAQVFPDLTALLGKGAVQALATGETPSPKQRVVIAPGSPTLDKGVPPNRVVALAPQTQLAALLGLASERLIPMQNCLLTSTDPDLALLSERGLQLPIEGSVTVYERGSATAKVIATLRCSDGEHPALYRLDRASAEPAFMFAFNAPQALVRTRQGDPALKGQEIDGVEGARPSDLFARDLDPSQLNMPFSDLFMEALLELVEGPAPSLRFWHNPVGTRGVLIVTSDQDFATERELAIFLAALAQWKVPATFYLTSGTYQPDAQQNPHGAQRLVAPNLAFVARSRELGISFGAHTWLAPTRQPVQETIKTHQILLAQGYGLQPHSSRFHRVIWPGYEEPAQHLADAGYLYDTSYITLNSKHIDGLGYMTGGGLPLPFYTPQGVALRIRQLATQVDDHPHPLAITDMVDEKGRLLAMPYTRLIAITRGLIEASGRHYHSPVVVNNHPSQFVDDPYWMRMMIETSRVERLAVLDVEGYDAFLQALRDSTIDHAPNGNTYRVMVQADEQDVMIRHYRGDFAMIDGAKAALRTATLFDRTEKLVTLKRGLHEITLP